MKKLVALLVATAFTMPVLAAGDKGEPVYAKTTPNPVVSPEPDAPKTKKVCVTQKDAKTGKDKEVCKTIKVHKKHEGTKVEGATKDAKAPAKK